MAKAGRRIRVSMHAPVVALIGAGGIARLHVVGWSELDVQSRVYSPSGAGDFAARHPGTVATASIEEAFAGADFVDICSPTDTHRDVASLAFNAGLDVVCEKPLARTTDDAQHIVDDAAAAGRKVMPAHVVRWFSEYEAAHSNVAAGDLGTLNSLTFTRTGARPERDWFHDLERSGGMVLDLMIHDLDQALWNAGPAASVGGTFHAPAPDGSVTAEAHVEHVSGAHSTVLGTWGPPGTTFRTTFEIAGAEGVLDHDSTAHRQGRLEAREARMGTGWLPPVASTSPYHLMLADFLAWVRTDAALPRITPADGVSAVRLGEAALAAVTSGTTVAL